MDPERIHQLSLEFSTLQQESLLNFQRIQSYLSQKSGKSFNRLLLNEVFKQIGCDENSTISFQDFIEAYSKTEQYLKSDIADLKQEISESRLRITDLKKEIIQSRGNPPECLLMLTVHGAVYLKGANPPNKKPPFLVVTCQQSTFMTQPSPHPISPVWNESFTVILPNSQGEIQFQLKDEDDVIGVGSISLSNFENMEKYEEHVPFAYNGKIRGSVNFTVQLMMNKITHLESLVSELEVKNELNSARLISVERFFSDLVTPLSSTNASISGYIDVKAAEASLSKTMDNLAEKFFGREVQWDTATIVCVHLFMVLSTFACFYRSDFFDVSDI